MDISDVKIVQDTNLFGAVGVSLKWGRKVVKDLESAGLVSPLRTPTGRRILSFREAEIVMNSVPELSASRREAMVSEGSSSRVA